MYRIGIIGSENSHAAAFAEIFGAGKDGKYSDIEVVAIGGIDHEASLKVQEICPTAQVIDRAEDMVDLVDAAMITSRDGALHLAQAKPFLEAGKPLFVDKPFTRNTEEAITLIQMAQEKGIPLVGGSSVKYADAVLRLARQAANGEVLGGDVTAPVNMVNEYGGFFFYASHLVEVMMHIFGYDIQEVLALRSGKGVTAVARYADFDVTNHFQEGCYVYSATLYQKGKTQFEELDIQDIYQKECENFAHMLRTGHMDETYEQLIRPVFYMEALEKSYTTGTVQKIERRI